MLLELFFLPICAIISCHRPCFILRPIFVFIKSLVKVSSLNEEKLLLLLTAKSTKNIFRAEIQHICGVASKLQVLNKIILNILLFKKLCII